MALLLAGSWESNLWHVRLKKQLPVGKKALVLVLVAGLLADLGVRGEGVRAVAIFMFSR